MDDITVRMGMSLEGFLKGLQSAKAEANNFVATWQRWLGLGALGVITAGLGAIWNGVEGRAKALRAASENIGMSVENIQGFARIMRDAGVSAESSTDSLARFANKIAQAQAGDKAAVDFFAGVGISVETLGGQSRNTTSVLRDFMNKLRDIPNEAERTRLAVEAMGRAGIRMASGLSGGSDALDKMSSKFGNLTSWDVAAMSQGRELVENAKMDFWASMSKVAILAKVAAVGWMSGPEGIRRMAEETIAFQKAAKKQYEYQAGGTIKEDPARRAKLMEAENKLRIEEAKGKEKINELTRQANALEAEAVKANAANDPGGELPNLEREEKMLKARELRLQIGKAEDELDKKRADYKEKLVSLTRQELDIEKQISDQKQKLSDAQTDRYRFTLAEVAGAAPVRGNWWRNRNILGAQQVMRAEAFGRYAAGLGRGDIAERAFSYADQVRGGLDALKSNERLPFDEMNRSAAQSEKHLADIRQKIKNFDYENSSD